MISLYVHPTCSSCRKASALLEELGVGVERRDYFRDRFTSAELRSVLHRAGRTPTGMLSTRARAYRELNIAERDLQDEDLIDLMVAEPTLLRRPLAVSEAGSTIGFNAVALASLARATTTAGPETTASVRDE